MDVVKGPSILSGMLVSEVSRVAEYLKTSNNIFKNDINEVIYKTETGSQISKKNKINKLMVTKGEMWKKG